MKRLSITDIANMAGVSKTTVSFILNGKAGEKNISQKTQNHIWELVHKYNYQPNYLAKSLKYGKTNTIGCLVPSISNAFFTEFVRIVEQIASDKNYQVLFASTNDDAAKEAELITNMISRQIEGIIIASTKVDSEMIHSLLNDRFPLVLFDRESEQVDANYVLVENKLAMKEAVAELAIRGCSKIGLLARNTEISSIVQRIEGFFEATREHDLKASQVEFVKDYKSKKEIQTQLTKLLEKGVDGIAFTNHELIADSVWTLNTVCSEYYNKVELAGFDNLDIFDYAYPGIISVEQPIRDIAIHSMELLAGCIEDNTRPYKRISLMPRLVKRNYAMQVNQINNHSLNQ